MRGSFSAVSTATRARERERERERNKILQKPLVATCDWGTFRPTRECEKEKTNYMIIENENITEVVFNQKAPEDFANRFN